MSLVKSSALSFLPAAEIPSRACVNCKRRKVKCSGNPCLLCIKKGIQCEFVDAKKRGPQQKKLKTILNDIEKTQSNNPIFCKIEEGVANLFQQRNIVQLYFNTIGLPIPADFRSPFLYESPKNESIKCQLYIISAHVLSSLGNKELAFKYNKAALSVSPTFFGCFSTDNAITLIMMVLYLGISDPQSWFFASSAFNITKMLPQTPQTLRVQEYSQSLVNLSDPSLSSPDLREMFLLNNLPKNKENISPNEWFVICSTKIQMCQKYILKFDSSLHSFTKSFQSYVNIDPSDLVEFQKLLQEMEDLRVYENELSNKKILHFHIAFNNFLLSWRLGNIEEAKTHVNTSLEIFKEEKFSISIQFHTNTSLLFMPFFIQQYIGPDAAKEGFNQIGEVMAHQGKSSFFNNFCNEVNSQLNVLIDIPIFDTNDLIQMQNLDLSKFNLNLNELEQEGFNLLNDSFLDNTS